MSTLSLGGGSHLGVLCGGSLLGSGEQKGEKVRINIQKAREYLKGGNQVSPKSLPFVTLIPFFWECSQRWDCNKQICAWEQKNFLLSVIKTFSFFRVPVFSLTVRTPPLIILLSTTTLDKECSKKTCFIENKQISGDNKYCSCSPADTQAYELWPFVSRLRSPDSYTQ